MARRSTRSPASTPTSSFDPYQVTEVGTDCVRVDFYSAVKVPHFVAHVFTFDEAMALAKAITTAALNTRPRGNK